MSSIGSVPDHSLAPFFGGVDPQYQKLLAEDKFAHETFNLPKAYEGKNKHLESVLDYLITEADAWYTKDILPWVLTEDLSVKWDIFRFNKTLMDLEPHQGVPRYVTAERESRSDRLVRRGLAFIIEHGFYKTDQGRQHYLMNLRQIVDSVNETAYHGVIHALLTSQNHYLEWERQHGTTVVRPSQLLAQERRRWAVVQKQERGFYLLDAELKDTMKYEGVVPNSWILPSKFSIYVTMVPSSEVEFYRKGPGAAANLEKGPDNFLTFRGSKVFETRPFDIDFIGEPRDLLVRERQIGEFFKFPAARNVGARVAEIRVDNAGVAVNVAPIEQRDIYIYSMDSDSMEKISYQAAWEVAYANASSERMDGYTGDILGDVQLLPGNAGPLGDDNANFAKNRIYANSTVLLLRPFQTYNMASGVLIKGGLDTGFTAHGHHDFQLTDDVIHKVHIGHYTFYHKSIIKQPKNMIIAHDIFAHSYVGGEGTSFFRPEGYNENAPIAGVGPHTFKVDARNDRFHSSLIPILIPAIGANSKVQNPLDITGKYSAQTLDASNTQMPDDVEHYHNASNVSAKLGFNYLQNYGSAEAFLSPLRHLNTMCFQGYQVSRAAGATGDDLGKFTKTVINTGHWGPNVYPGCRAVRNGEMAFLKDMEYEKGVTLD